MAGGEHQAQQVVADVVVERRIHRLREVGLGHGVQRVEFAADLGRLALGQQDRRRWDPLLVRRGLAALERAEALGGARGPYALQAAIAACHARAPSSAQTDWARIAALYGTLAEVAPSPVVELNRAVAVARSEGPAPALAIVERLRADAVLRRYQWLPGVHGDLLEQLGRHDEARAAFLEAAALAGNARERELMQQRAKACDRPRP